MSMFVGEAEEGTEQVLRSRTSAADTGPAKL